MQLSKNLNYFTVDLEEWFQGTDSSRMDKFHSFTSRIEPQVEKLLFIFEKYNVKATFFILGSTVYSKRNILREIIKKGHEVASHGWSHELIYRQSQATFREETIYSKKFLEDTISEEVIGYRASNWSITKKSLWALDILQETGFKYDSSIYPVKNYSYGIKNYDPTPHMVGGILEIPPSIFQFMNFRMPYAGGFYMRLIPSFIGNLLYFLDTNKEKIFYIHPWEIDSKQPIIDMGSKLNNFIHYYNIKSMEGKINNILKKDKWTSIKNGLVY